MVLVFIRAAQDAVVDGAILDQAEDIEHIENQAAPPVARTDTEVVLRRLGAVGAEGLLGNLGVDLAPSGAAGLHLSATIGRFSIGR
jgi:hypothetical protein